jgi:hypothetical protein
LQVDCSTQATCEGWRAIGQDYKSCALRDKVGLGTERCLDVSFVQVDLTNPLIL